ncbi:MAG: NUDIX domain-containing protein [Candidatus Accumulibacter sp.]|uniref:NUDIX domain-containing protein n=1 Tax=Candidatus Accumulibacter affinis TaxID=2954384 RepID=A0A935T3V5_9PROT|nr:NUDIX domain-containing protein [Candidatus Accumulibacter affinis]
MYALGSFATGRKSREWADWWAKRSRAPDFTFQGNRNVKKWAQLIDLQVREMLDREGYRPNVGIILCNARNEVFWGKRIREHSWQFPQGGIQRGETPEQAMYRSCMKKSVCCRNMFKFSVEPKTGCVTKCRRIGSDVNGVAVTGDKSRSGSCFVSLAEIATSPLRACDHPEFDAWRWNTYWVSLEAVIEFKRRVYEQALNELARFLNADHRRVRHPPTHGEALAEADLPGEKGAFLQRP